MLKRIMSVFLVLTMVLAMCVTASAASITSTSKNIVLFDGGMSTTKKTLTSVTSIASAAFYATDSSYPYSYTSGSATGISVSGGSGVVNATRENDLTGCYEVASGTTLTSTYFNYGATLKGYGYLLSVSYDVMIPDDANVDSARSYAPTFAASTNGNTDPSSFTVKYEDKKFTIDQTSMTGIDTATVVTDTVAYTPGSWVNLEIRAYFDSTTKKLTYGAYVGESQIFYAQGNVEYAFDASTQKATMYLSKFVWSQPSAKTYYDNIYYRALTAADASTTFTPVYVEEEPEPEEPAGPEITRLVLWNFDDLTTTPATNSLVVSYVSDGNLLYNPRTIAHSGTTNRNTVYAGEERTDNGKALVITTGTTAIDESNPSAYTVIVNNTRRNYGKYGEADGNEYVVEHSYEIYIPSASADTKRTYQFGFNLTGQNINDYFIEANTENGKLEFDINPITENVKIVDFTERTKTADVASDAWNRISFIKSITYDVNAGLYNIKIYGLLNDVCYYEAQVKGYNASDLYMVTQSWNIKGLDDKEVVTKLDNIKISSYSAMPAINYAWTDAENYIYPLALNYADNSVEAKAKVVGEFENLCLVAAVYNESGALEKLWTDTTLEDGYLSYTVTGSNYVNAGNSVKAFLFDSLTSIIPYVEKAELVIQ